ncbi:HD domain-containing phosphohydrolase [Fimbriimonas ginsengisoli]|uniref:Response regulator receiver modulated metal dependent phosphohydrolase n=1 Tax=Fimbriimonas ginsengisoli Gsoil 348 TaxID=661478 RepID=A0A068NVV1_FIMGI|nr:HD domain-containing phosphohydrolase [Fimbriimonas ginsengisoli]AIE87492.1 response regulator receiver modulated metal dependent phosphohydrolase [Fimbriimonas ginsengisoli Gsoil 348]
MVIEGKVEELRDSSILIVDDEDDHLVLLSHALRRAGCAAVHTVSDPFRAAEMHRQVNPDLMLLDYRLPPIDGFRVLADVWAHKEPEDRNPVIMITGGAEDAVRLKALDLGVSDFLEHPSDMLELTLRVRNVLRIHKLYRQVQNQMRHLDEMVQERTQQLEFAQREILDRLALAAEFRDDATGEHARRVGFLSQEISVELGMEPWFCDAIASAALLHDLGKIGLRDAVLLKPAKLTPIEFAHIQTHPEIGAQILAGCNQPVLLMAREIALTHHERWDGKGYPSRLAGENIPISGRIVAVADAYDAMTTARPYKEAMTRSSALAEISRSRGTQFDPQIVDAFLRCQQHVERVAG